MISSKAECTVLQWHNMYLPEFFPPYMTMRLLETITTQLPWQRYCSVKAADSCNQFKTHSPCNISTDVLCTLILYPLHPHIRYSPTPSHPVFPAPSHRISPVGIFCTLEVGNPCIDALSIHTLPSPSPSVSPTPSSSIFPTSNIVSALTLANPCAVTPVPCTLTLFYSGNRVITHHWHHCT